MRSIERGRLTGLARAAVAGAFVFGVFVTVGEATAQDANCGKPADCLARQLISTIPTGEKIALRPFLPKETGIPAETGKRLYDNILTALFGASGGKHKIIGRDRMERIWKIWEAQFIGDFAKFIEQNRASVEIVCNVASHGTGLELSCTGIPIGKNKSVAAAAAAQQVFPLKQERFQIEHGLAEIARRLAALAAGTDRAGRALIFDNRSDQQSELTGFLGGRVKLFFNRRQAARRKLCDRERNAQEVLQSVDGTRCGKADLYILRGRLWWPDTRTVELQLSLVDGKDSVAEEWVKIDRQTLPARYLPPDGARQAFYTATAKAVISPNLDRKSAMRAAHNLARARVVAQALGIRAPAVKEILTEADGIFALVNSLNHGIPVEERFSSRVDDSRIKVELQARVRKIGSRVRPALKAKLERSLVRAFEPLTIKLAAEETIHVALFAWGADNRVVRLYPNTAMPDLVIRGGESLTLPRAGEDRILSAPLPVHGNIADHEAFIVVASGKALDFEKLARRAGDSLAATAKVAVTGAVFFDRLATLDLSHLSVIFLPYQVSKMDSRGRAR